MTKKIYDHLSRVVLHPDGVTMINEPISEEMFQVSDIVKVTEHPDRKGLITVQLQGLNGIVPLRLFSEKAKEKILSWEKVRKTKLWGGLDFWMIFK